MTEIQKPAAPKLIHIAKIFAENGVYNTLFLRQAGPHLYRWFKYMGKDNEIETTVSGHSIEDALRQARLFWKEDSFRTINCGFRYTLPERDEHGMNAYFHQMASSYSSMNGVYFDEEAGHNCFVQNASDEAKALLNSLFGNSKP